MKINKKNLVGIAATSAALLGVSFLLAGPTMTVLAQSVTPAVEWEEKIIENVDTDRDFSSERVLVVLDKSISNPTGILQERREELFDCIEYESITDLSKVTLNDSLEEYYSENTFRQILKIDLPVASEENVLTTIERLQKEKGIVYVGPDYINEGAYAPNDPYYTDNYMWGLNGTYGIDAPAAWEITTGSQEVVVGVIDTGIASHEDLSTKLTTGYDFYNEDNTTSDDEAGHGTHVAGIIAAAGNNSRGIVGVAPNVKLSPLQTCYAVSGNSGSHYDSDILEAISFAAGFWGTPYQISVLNNSNSKFGTKTAFLYCISQYPGLFVWSAGNDHENVDTFSDISKFNLDNLISVGAINSSGTRSSFSNYGNNVDIYAPGSGIWSTVLNNTYAAWNGTSMAAPYVSGVAALLLSMNPGLTAAQVKESIINGGTNINIVGYDSVTYPSVRLSAIGALNYAQNHYAYRPAPLRLSVISKNDNTWRINLKNPNPQPVYAAYNSKMCFSGDAKNFSGLNDIVDIEIGAYASKVVDISENGTAGWITASIGYSIGDQHYRVISAAHGLSEGYVTFNYYIEQQTILVLGYSEVSSIPNHLTFSITNKKSNGKWTVTINNNNSFDVNVVYNSKTCFVGDAEDFNVSDGVAVTIAKNSSKTVTISVNGLATYITAEINYYYHGFAYSRITYAKAAIGPTCKYNAIRHL